MKLSLRLTMNEDHEMRMANATVSLFGSTHDVVRAALAQTERVACPLCHVWPKPFAVNDLGFQLCRCPSCGLQFSSLCPTVEQLTENIYNETYFAESQPARALSEPQRDHYGRQLANLNRLLGRCGTVLDVGCGDGLFLRYAQTEGWQVTSTDIRLASRAREINCPLWEGQLPEIDFGATRFDVIRFNHVLGHTQNPLLELMRSRDLLAPGGIVFIGVPNIAGLSPRLKNAQSRLRLKRKRWRHYAAVHHLWFFSPQTLRQIAERAGLRVLYWETPRLKKTGTSSVIEQVYGKLLESSRAASLLDFYCAARQQG